MPKPLKIGIIGASPDRGWASISHIPAIQGLPGLELAAVVGTTQAKADAAAKAFGAPAAYAAPADLFHDPNIDIVSICVKVPDHRDLVLAALAAHKHLYCEWPLGRNLAEAQELAAAAKAAGGHAAIGLQARANPAVLRARELVASGAIGRVLSARIVSNAAAFGPTVDAAMTYTENPANGANLITIQAAHTLDCAFAVLGPFASLTALTSIQYPKLEFPNGESRTRTNPDHVLIQATVPGSAPLSIEVAGGRPPDAATFRFEITGETGDIRLNGGSPRGFQADRLRLALNGKTQHLDQGELTLMPDPAANVAGIYALLRDDILNGTNTAPTFDHALRLTLLMNDILNSSRSGTRKAAEEWPKA